MREQTVAILRGVSYYRPRCTTAAVPASVAGRHGLKVQVVATSDGVPVEFHLHADAGYTDYVAKDLFHEASGSQQQTARRKNSKRSH